MFFKDLLPLHMCICHDVSTSCRKLRSINLKSLLIFVKSGFLV